MPALMAHAGRWGGNFQHFDNEGQFLESHQAVVQHQFPEEGPDAHVQDSPFIWESDFVNVPGNISQTSYPHLPLNEMICLEPKGNRRSRVRQWFKNGRLFKRTLCRERRISNTR
ncbi:hypothetical protein [Parasphingorhabdus sp.]